MSEWAYPGKPAGPCRVVPFWYRPSSRPGQISGQHRSVFSTLQSLAAEAGLLSEPPAPPFVPQCSEAGQWTFKGGGTSPDVFPSSPGAGGR